MSIYQLPEINFKQLQAPEKDKKPILNHILIGLVIILAVGILLVCSSWLFFASKTKPIIL